MGNNFYEDRNRRCTAKIRRLCEGLPPLCGEFFLGIEPRTTPLTRLNYAYDLKLFFTYLCAKKYKNKLAPEEVTFESLQAVTVTDIELYLDYLSLYVDKNGVQHANNEKGKARALSTLRSFFKYFFNKDKISANIAAKVEPPKLHSKDIVRLEVDEVVKLLDEAESGDDMSINQKYYHKKTKTRDVAMLTLFLGTGIRISECIGLNVNDIDLKNNSFRVTRKGGNIVILYFSDEVASALKTWLDERSAIEGIGKESALFISTHTPKTRISIRAVQNLVKKYSSLIAPLKRITPHKLRSTYGTNLYRETQDIYVVAEVLGHKDVNTTKKHYAAISEDIRRSASTKVILREDKSKI